MHATLNLKKNIIHPAQMSCIMFFRIPHHFLIIKDNANHSCQQQIYPLVQERVKTTNDK